jgi:hypothetical protein
LNIRKPRQAGFVNPLFKPAWDYNLESLEPNVVLPTLNLFSGTNGPLLRRDLQMSHNNVSHTERLGLITLEGSGFTLTQLGEELLDNETSFEEVVRQYLPFYHLTDENTGSTIYPYKAVAYCLDQIGTIRKVDFMFGIFTLTDTSHTSLTRAAEVIRDLQHNYPDHFFNNRSLTIAEKTSLLDELNNHFGTTYVYEDLWTAATTVSNRFNYFMNHLSVYLVLSRQQRSFRAFRFSDLM